MNGLPTTLTVVAVGGLIAAGAALWMGYIMERRVPPKSPRLTVLDVLAPPPDVTAWTGEGWTEQDGARFRHPSTQGLLRREAGE